MPGGRDALTFSQTNGRSARGTAPLVRRGQSVREEDRRRPGPPMAESQLSELRNMRVLLEEARGLARNLAYHRRARLESTIGEALEEVDRQIQELRAAKG